MNMEDSSDKWKYVIILSKFMLLFLEVAVTKSFGVLIPTMVRVFSANASSLGFVCSLPTSMMYLSCLPMAYLLKSGRLSPRLMAMIGALISSLGIALSGFLTSVTALGCCLALTGIGLSMGYLPAKVLINDYFQGDYVLMNSISNLGSTAGALVVPVITERALQAYGYSGAMLVLGGISLHAVAAGAAFRTKEPSRKSARIERDMEEARETDVSSAHQALSHCILIEEPLVSISLPCIFLMSFLIQSWTLFLVPRAIGHGIPSSEAVLLSSIGGAGGILGRTLSIAILYLRADFIVVYLILSIVSTATFLFDPLLTSFPVMCISAFVQGLCIFTSGMASSAFLKSSVSDDNFALAAGIYGLVFGIGGNVGSLLSGTIRDKTGSYTAVFLALGIIGCVNVLLIAGYLVARKRWKV